MTLYSRMPFMLRAFAYVYLWLHSDFSHMIFSASCRAQRSALSASSTVLSGTTACASMVLPDHPGDVSVPDPFLQEILDRHFVRGRQHRRHAASRFQRFERKGQAGKPLQVGLLEGERADGGKVEPRRNIGQAARDRKARRRWALSCRACRAGPRRRRRYTRPWNERCSADAPAP